MSELLCAGSEVGEPNSAHLHGPTLADKKEWN